MLFSSPFLIPSHFAERIISLGIQNANCDPRASKQTPERQAKLYAWRRKQSSLFLRGRGVKKGVRAEMIEELKMLL